MMWAVYGDLLVSIANTSSVTFDIVSDYLNAQEFLGNNANQTTVNSTLSNGIKETHQIWGTVAMLLIFLPGAVLFLPAMLAIYQKPNNEWGKCAFMFMTPVICAMLPFFYDILPFCTHPAPCDSPRS